jgi:hypothetical protein
MVYAAIAMRCLRLMPPGAVRGLSFMTEAQHLGIRLSIAPTKPPSKSKGRLPAAPVL